MKGLERIPGTEDLRAAYERLQAQSVLTITELVLYAQWSRFDPRLGEQWVEWMSVHWESISVQELRAHNAKAAWPQALALLLEFVFQLLKYQRHPVLLLFKKWRAYVVFGVAPAHNEQFFIGLAQLAGKSMLKDARYATRPYRQWGYLAQETLLHRFDFGEATALKPCQRRQQLDELLQKKPRLTVGEYMLALRGLVSRRQAERDLRSHPALRPNGATRGRFYVKRH